MSTYFGQSAAARAQQRALTVIAFPNRFFLLSLVVPREMDMLDRSLAAEFESYRKTLSTEEARRAFDERIESLLVSTA